MHDALCLTIQQGVVVTGGHFVPARSTNPAAGTHPAWGAFHDVVQEHTPNGAAEMAVLDAARVLVKTLLKDYTGGGGEANR